MPYAILRTQKLSTLQNVASSAMHNFRERNTPNADPRKLGQNVTAGAQSKAALLDALSERLKTVGTVRKNAVLAVEYMITASPEWFKGKTLAEINAYLDDSEKWLRERHGNENVLAVTRHFDEKSPHIAAFVVPVDPRGKLNCSHFLGNRELLASMQTHFAKKAAAHHGLERGAEGSKATHTSIQQFYKIISDKTPDITVTVPEVPAASRKDHLAAAAGIKTEHSTAVAAAKKAQADLDKQRAARIKSLEAKVKQLEVDALATAAIKAENKNLKAEAGRLRETPLQAVLERLGATPDPKDKDQWRTPGGRVSVKGSKFFNHDAGKGGGGAIDLVMQSEGMAYADALRWLVSEFGVQGALNARIAQVKQEVQAVAVGPAPPFSPPEPVQQHWPRVRAYLTQTRALAASLVDQLHQAGKVYADRFANAVFVLGDRQGVELRGTGERPFHGVRGAKAVFVLPGSEKAVATVESAIDALSLRQNGFNGTVVATAGSASETLLAVAKQAQQRGFKLYAAQDRDTAGERTAAWLVAEHGAERMAPKNKDWNEDVQEQARDAARVSSVEQLRERLHAARNQAEQDQDRDLDRGLTLS